jgi:tyrosine-protein kinase Etk/Wzc
MTNIPVVKQKIINSQIEIQTLQAKVDALNRVIEEHNTQFAQIPSKNIEFARLQRTKLSNEKLYLTIQEKFDEATISEQSEFGYLEIVDSATVPTHPSSPKVY